MPPTSTNLAVRDPWEKGPATTQLRSSAERGHRSLGPCEGGPSNTPGYQLTRQGHTSAPSWAPGRRVVGCRRAGSGASLSPDTMLRHLRASAAMKNFSEFRQEASTLHALQHPCIVALLGITIHPLAFALELAPLGSLNTVLAENAKGRAGAGTGGQGPRAGPGQGGPGPVDGTGQSR